jgi:hypothetical protein
MAQFVLLEIFVDKQPGKYAPCTEQHYEIVILLLIVGTRVFVISLQNNQQISRGSSGIYCCILDLPQHVSASCCHHQGS